MMSAKPLVNESCPVVPSAATAAVPATGESGSESTDFATLLTGAAPGVDLSLATSLPAQSIAQLVANKPAPKAAPLPATVAKKPTELASDILELLADESELLPLDLPATGEVEKPEVHVEPAETKAGDEDILSEWMDAMIPSGVFAPQAGSQQQAGDNAPGGAPAKHPAAATPISLNAQAGLLAEGASASDGAQ